MRCRSTTCERVAHRVLTSAVAVLALYASMLLSAAPARAETRGYVISWFATASNNPDFAVNCPRAFKDPDSRFTTNFQFTPPTMSYMEGQTWNSGYADAAPAWSLQISGADLSRDGAVTVTLDRTLDHLQRDALGGVVHEPIKSRATRPGRRSGRQTRNP